MELRSSSSFVQSLMSSLFLEMVINQTSILQFIFENNFYSVVSQLFPPAESSLICVTQTLAFPEHYGMKEGREQCSGSGSRKGFTR